MAIAPSADADHAFDHAGLLQEAADARNREAKPVVHLRAVIEFTNVCHRNCLYCGMRMANKSLGRYEMERAGNGRNVQWFVFDPCCGSPT